MIERDAVKLLVDSYPALAETIDPKIPDTFSELKAHVEDLDAEASIGDTLVLFVVREIAETYDPEDADCVAYQMRRAAEELHTIADAFTKAQGA